MRYVHKNKNNYFIFRMRTPKILLPYFHNKELIKSLRTNDYNAAKLRAEELVINIKKLVSLKRLNMLDDAMIKSLVENYIESRLHRDYEARVRKVSFQNCPKKPQGKDALHVNNIAQKHEVELSNFNVESIRFIAEEFASRAGEVLDITNPLHQKLSLEILRAHITVLREIHSRNSGKWLYEKTPTINTSTTKITPSINETIKLYIKHYISTAKIKQSQQKQIQATQNFLNDVASPFLNYYIHSLEDIDYEDVQEIAPKIINLPNRLMHQDLDIKDYLENIQHSPNDIKKISVTTANKYIKWIKGYFTFLYDTQYTSSNLSQFITSFSSSNARFQRDHFEKNEVMLLLEKCRDYNKDIELIVKIIAYTGMRTSEFFKCTLEEDTVNKILYFDLTSPFIKLKTKSSYRIIPLHHELIPLKKDKFRDLQIIYGENIEALSKKVNGLIKKHISKSPKKVFYSLRHSFSTFLKYEMVAYATISELIGHAISSSMTETRYTGLQNLNVLKEAIDKLSYRE